MSWKNTGIPSEKTEKEKAAWRDIDSKAASLDEAIEKLDKLFKE